MSISALKLCLLTHLQNQSFDAYCRFLHTAIEGGVTSIQLREKQKNLQAFKQLALQLKLILKPLRIPLILNDHVEIANEIDADGVHIGQSDLSPDAARKILGPNKLIGWSVETVTELEIANNLTSIDYIAASAVFESPTKLDCKTIWGIAGLQQLTQHSKHPVVAIGGIDRSNIRGVMEAGACGVAVISAIHDAQNPKHAATDLMTIINETRTTCLIK